MSHNGQPRLAVVFHEPGNAMAIQLEGRIAQLRAAKPGRQPVVATRSTLAQQALNRCDVTYVVLRECWKL